MIQFIIWIGLTVIGAAFLLIGCAGKEHGIDGDGGPMSAKKKKATPALRPHRSQNGAAQPTEQVKEQRTQEEKDGEPAEKDKKDESSAVSNKNE